MISHAYMELGRGYQGHVVDSLTTLTGKQAAEQETATSLLMEVIENASHGV